MATAAGIEAAKAFVKLYLEDSALRGGLAKLQGTISSAASGLGKVGLALGATAITGGAALVASGFTAAAASVWRFVDAGAGLDDIANRTGASAEALSQLRYAAEQSGTDLGAVEKGMRRLGDVQTQAAAGSKSAAAALASVGLSASKLATMSVEERFLAVADGIDRIQDPAAKASVAMDLLGKSGADLVPMMEGGRASIVDMMQQADRLGMTISGPQAKAAAAFDDTWQSLTAALRSAGNVIAVAVLPYVTQFLQLAVQALPAVLNLASAIGSQLVQGMRNAFEAIASVIDPFGNLQSAATDTISAIGKALTAGDVTAAARIFWLSLKAAWLTGTDAIAREWSIWKKGFVDTFAAAVQAVRTVWADTQNYLSRGIVDIMAFFDKSINAEAVKAELDVMTTQQKQQIDQQAAADQSARDAAFEQSIGAVNSELATARDEWAKAVQAAGAAAASAANQPNTANIAAGKFTELIQDLKTGDIATRVDKAVQQAGPAQDIRTTGGAQALTRILNQGGQLSQQQQRILLEQRDVQRRLLTVTERGYIGWQV
jgi:hypothetical protein